MACSFQYVLIAFLRSRFKVQQGLNFTVDIEFGFVTMISVKQPEGKKKRVLFRFFMMLKTVIFVLVQIEKVIVCKKADFLGLLDILI